MSKLTVQRAKVGDVRNWVEALGVLCSDNMTPTEAEMKVQAYVPVLQDDFPPAAFCQDSLAHVARGCKFFPAYSDVHTHLSAWWRAHRPAPPRALPPPAPMQQREPPTEEEIAHVRACVQQIIANLHSRDSEPRFDEPMAPQPQYLTPWQLDRVNPLPNGRRRVPELLK